MTTIEAAAQRLAQVLAGSPIPTDPDWRIAPAPYDALLSAIAEAPDDRLRAFEQTLALLPPEQAGEIRRTVFKQPVRAETAAPAAQTVQPTVPPLPAAAHLDGDSLDMLRDHWVGRYCAYAQRAASMSPIDFHLARRLRREPRPSPGVFACAGRR